MSLLKGLSVLWRGMTGGEAGFRANALITVEATEQTLLKMGYDPVKALHGGLGEELLNVAKLLPFAQANSEHALAEAEIFMQLQRDDAIRVFLDYAVWRVYKSEDARERLERDLGPLIEGWIAGGRFDPIAESVHPTFAWSCFKPAAAFEKALKQADAAKRRRLGVSSDSEERTAAADTLRSMLDEWYGIARTHSIVQGRPEDKVHLHCMLHMFTGAWRHLGRTCGQSAVVPAYVSDRDFEMRPFLELESEEGRRAAREYLVWRLYPEMADEELVRRVVRRFAEGPAGQEGWILHAKAGEGGIHWLDLVKGDRLTRPWYSGGRSDALK